MAVPVILTDNFILQIMKNGRVQELFPEFRAYHDRVKNHLKAGSCKSCQGKRAIVDETVGNAREFVLAMPGGQRQRLKGVLGMADRTFLAYRRKGSGAMNRVEV